MTRVFCYLTVVTLQYLVPVLLILFSTLALKALGKYVTMVMKPALFYGLDPFRPFLSQSVFNMVK